MKKKTKSKAEAGDDWDKRLARFLCSPLAARATEGLREGCCIAVHVEEETYFFRRAQGMNSFTRKGGEKPDLEFWAHADTMRYLVALAEGPETGIATLGVAIFEHLLTADKAQKIRFQVGTGFFGLWSKGYFSVLKAGGPEVTAYLARFGLTGLGAIQEVIRKLRK